ncbi:MAG TPA: hypothetical protein VFU81_17330 [Thermomicrobiales bacterium]|nr:hypothetical protein [Thermomicrobiales bacterium]
MTARTARIVAILAAMLLLAASCPTSAAMQWSGEDVGMTDASYTSPTWGYTVRWRNAEWTLDRQDSASGDDVLQLANDKAFVRYEGTAQFGDDPAACRKQLLATLTGIDGVSDLEIVPSSDGNLIWFQDDARADGLYIFRFDQNGSGGDWLAWLDCQSLVPGKSVLAISQIGPVDSFDLEHAQAQRVVRPRQSVFPYAEIGQADLGSWSWPVDCDAGQIEDQMDDAVFNDATPTPGMKYVLLQARYYNPMAGASASLAADASTLFLLDMNDVVYWPIAFRWSGDPADPTAAQQEIPQGAGADLVLVFEIPASATPSRLQNAILGQSTPTLADPLGCLRLRNGLAVQPHLEQWEQPNAREPQVSFVFAPDGTERGMVTWLDGTTDPSLGDVVLLDFTNTGQATWTIDPTNIIAENRFNQPQVLQWRPQTIELDADPAAPETPTLATGAIDLDPGQRVAIRFSFPANALGCSKVIYVAASNQYVPIGDGPCSAGGGAAPVLRTGR